MIGMPKTAVLEPGSRIEEGESINVLADTSSYGALIQGTVGSIPTAPTKNSQLNQCIKRYFVYDREMAC
jgi:hypothetical protein